MEKAWNPEKTTESHQEGYDVMKIHQSKSSQGYGHSQQS